MTEPNLHCIYDPATSVLDNFKNIRLDAEYALSNSGSNLKNSKQDITLSSSNSPERSKCLLLDSLKSYVNSAVSLL